MNNIETPPEHPGEILAEELFRRGMTQVAAAQLLGVKRAAIQRLINGRHSLSPAMAYRLERAGVYTAAEWLAKQAAYDVWKLSHRPEFDAVELFPPHNAPERPRVYADCIKPRR